MQGSSKNDGLLLGDVSNIQYSDYKPREHQQSKLKHTILQGYSQQWSRSIFSMKLTLVWQLPFLGQQNW